MKNEILRTLGLLKRDVIKLIGFLLILGCTEFVLLDSLNFLFFQGKSLWPSSIMIDDQKLLLIVLVLYVFRTFIGILVAFGQAKITFGIMARMSSEITNSFKKGAKMDGRLLQNLVTEINQFSFGFVNPIVYLVFDLFSVLIAIMWAATIVGSIFLPTMVLFILIVSIMLRLLKKTVSELGIKRSYFENIRFGMLKFIIENFEFIRYSHPGMFFSEKYIGSVEAVCTTAASQQGLNQSIKYVLELLGFILILITASMTGDAEFIVIAGALGLAFARILPLANRISQSMQSLRYNALAARNIFSVIDSKPRIFPHSSFSLSEVLDNIARYKFTVLKGPSGSGKTTVLNEVIKELQTVSIDKQILYIGSNCSLPNISVSEFFSVFDLDMKLAEIAYHNLELDSSLGLHFKDFCSSKFDSSARSLSTGQIKRVWGLTAFSTRLKFIVADELSSGLDIALQKKLYLLLDSCIISEKKYLMTSHSQISIDNQNFSYIES